MITMDLIINYQHQKSNQQYIEKIQNLMKAVLMNKEDELNACLNFLGANINIKLTWMEMGKRYNVWRL